ncbi:MAG: PQQ-binding-like beta-propeller repeat protein [Planctomycetota bacterium]
MLSDPLRLRRCRAGRAVGFLALAVSSASSAGVAEDGPGAAADWPRFRGPGGLGVAPVDPEAVPFDRKAKRGVLWEAAVPRLGESSPIVWGDAVILTGGDKEAREVYAYDARTGKLLWRRAVERPAPSASPASSAPGGGKASGEEEKILYAAATPATDGRAVYAIFGTGDLAALDFEGRPVWTRHLGRPENDYGHASSLELWRGILLVQLDQASAKDGKSRLLGLEAASGRTLWEARRDVGASWSSPIAFEAAGREQVVAAGDPWVSAYDPKGGAELWRAKCLGGEVVPSPILASGLVIACSADGTLAAIRPDGTRDVTETHVAWASEEDLPEIASPVSAGGLLYTLTTGGVLACTELASGRRLWDHDLEASFQASPTVAGGSLYLLSDSGELVRARAARSLEILGRSSLGEPCQASPAFSGRRVFVRTRRHLVALGREGSP